MTEFNPILNHYFGNPASSFGPVSDARPGPDSGSIRVPHQVTQQQPLLEVAGDHKSVSGIVTWEEGRRGPRRVAAALARCCTIAAVAIFAAEAAPAQIPDIAPEAQRILKASSDFVAAQQRFTVSTRNSLEIVLNSGQKIEFNSTAQESIQRPDKLRAERTGDWVHQIFIYDGKSLTQFNPTEKVYARATAPGTIEEMLDFARTKLDVIAPAGDLVYKNSYDILMDGVTEGLVVGKAVIEGAPCHHLAFRGPQVDWQIWIQEGAQPLPRKLLITTRDLPSAPQFSITVTKWVLKPTFGAHAFDFTPPAGVTEIGFLSLLMP
jgi:hypothetical protein